MSVKFFFFPSVRVIGPQIERHSNESERWTIKECPGKVSLSFFRAFSWISAKRILFQLRLSLVILRVILTMMTIISLVSLASSNRSVALGHVERSDSRTVNHGERARGSFMRFLHRDVIKTTLLVREGQDNYTPTIAVLVWNQLKRQNINGRLRMRARATSRRDRRIDHRREAINLRNAVESGETSSSAAN